MRGGAQRAPGQSDLAQPALSGPWQAFVAARPYPLDRFQVEAMQALDEGRSVLVTAPTGAGKTVVAEYAVHLALHRGVKAYYTTPLKALSNQKFGDLRRAHGPESVGLLTGDNSINGDARVVVMTTEVLRNMIHGQRSSLAALGYVILDEVHFLEDRYRGGVWEEVILGAPPEVVLVCLSATVANAGELVSWIRQVRGDSAIVQEVRRPVELHNLFAIGDRSTERVHVIPTFVNGRPNPRAIELDVNLPRHSLRDRRPRTRPQVPGPVARGHQRSYRPRRSDVIERLGELDLLPAIYFVFSRAGCDEAARHCLEDLPRLTTAEERSRVREIVESYVEALSDEDLSVLGYGQFVTALEAGIASHHAGMVPPFREAVEACFSEALVKVVFATETLALGINMPARSVVIEDLTKFSGAGHNELTPGEYAQLTGRAGRRGIDDVGYAIVLASQFHTFDDVARLAGAPGRALKSSFRPTYNLAVSLVKRFDKVEAHRMVTSSFAQYLAEEDLGGQLDAVLEVLAERGYLAGWSVTPAGEMLAGIYHETDLLIAETIRSGVLDTLDPAGLAAAASAFCFEARREREGAAPPPSGGVAAAVLVMEDLAEGLSEREKELGLPVTRGVDVGFAQLARDWARGRDLRRILAGPTGAAGSTRPVPRRDRYSRQVMTGGDFVRNVKQIVDLLRQIAAVAPSPELRTTASTAASRLLRGVVAASSMVNLEEEDGTIHAVGAPAP
ncbi:MAG: DEAD/DEAH box helicase [Acidimicrobiales bacterium]